MNTSVLLQKLIEIERSLGVESESTTRRKVLDAQEYVLRLNESSEENPGTRASESDESGKFYLLRNFARAK